MYLIIYLVWLCVLTIFILYKYLPIIVTYKISDDVKDIVVKPTRHYHAACFDIYAVEDRVIPVDQWRVIRTGITFAPWPHIYIPFLKLTLTPFGNIAYKIHTRSGMALKGIRGHLGIIDNDYRDECNPILYNHGEFPRRIKKGNKIAQIEFYRVLSPKIWRRKNLSNSARGKEGFGSSGK